MLNLSASLTLALKFNINYILTLAHPSRGRMNKEGHA